MIIAGFALLAVGVSDLIRDAVPRRARRYVEAGVALMIVVLAALGGAVAAGIIAIAAAVAWRITMAADGHGRAGLWPVGVLGVLAASSVAVFGTVGGGAEMLVRVRFSAPGGDVSLAAVVLVGGAVAFLIWSGNVVVRTALRVAPRGARSAREGDASRREIDEGPTLKGGRVIGPLERVLVFALTLTGAYTLLAAVLAAKGIVRFPEISRDGERGAQAEYFLVGSLVSWVLALAAAFLTWWALGASAPVGR